MRVSRRVVPHDISSRHFEVGETRREKVMVEDLLGALRQTRPDQQVALVFVRGDQRQQVEVMIGSRST
jgi:hypothetical protein